MLQDVDDLMPIGEFSERSGLSAKRLRTYAAAGLLVPAAVDSSSGYRYYAPGQLRDARLIDALRGAGVPLADIASVLREPTAEQLDVWARAVEVDTTQRQAALLVARQLLLDTDAHPVDTSPKDGPMRLHTAARTDIGRVRETNEDATLCAPHVAAIADGMGGHPGGDTASALAVALVDAAFSGRSLDELEAAVRAANRAVFERAAHEHLEGMGTTLCAVGLIGDDLAVVNVGDSRAYLWRDGTLERLTDDHTLTAALVRRGELTEDEALDHPRRGILTRAVGVGPTVDMDTAVHDVRRGDRVLVCSDGLVNEVSDDEIAVFLAQSDRDAVTEALVTRAVERGGRDNISVVVADVS